MAVNRRKLMEERAKKLLEKSNGSFDYFILKEGTVRMRIPQIVEDQEFCVEVLSIFLGKELGGIISPATFGEPCPFMELYDKLKNSDKEEDIELMKKIKPRKKYLGPHYRYKDLKGKEPDLEAGVKLCMLPASLYQDIIQMYLDDEKGDFTDPKTGYDLKYTRTGSTLTDTEYSVLDCKPTPICKEFAKKVYNPEEMVRAIIPTYEEAENLLNKFLGTQSDSDEEDDEPKKKKHKDSDSKKDKKKKKHHDK